jgi:hypothetical protein
LGEFWPLARRPAIEAHKGSYGAFLREMMADLANLLGCEVSDLRLDHAPALALRKKKKKGGVIVGYVPDACDPAYLFYRPHGTQFEGSHDVKTRIRGDRGQRSDISQIKRARRAEKKANGILKPKRKIKSRGFDKSKRPCWPKGRKIARKK